MNAIPAVKALSHLPIFADPSHATGKRAMVPAAARAAVAAGADGLLIEVHVNQALLAGVVGTVRSLAESIKRHVETTTRAWLCAAAPARFA